MPKPHIKYKIVSSSRSWDICYESFHMKIGPNAPARDGLCIWMMQISSYAWEQCHS
jgi:hypothetical protein